jgi:hypothetical protein
MIKLSLESHRHLSINVSIVGEFATILLTCSFLIRFSATSHIVSPHILRRQPWWNASSLDCLLLSVPNFRIPRVLVKKRNTLQRQIILKSDFRTFIMLLLQVYEQSPGHFCYSRSCPALHLIIVCNKMCIAARTASVDSWSWKSRMFWICLDYL